MCGAGWHGKNLGESPTQDALPDSEFFWARIANPPASVKRKSRPQHQKLGIVLSDRTGTRKENKTQDTQLDSEFF